MIYKLRLELLNHNRPAEGSPTIDSAEGGQSETNIIKTTTSAGTRKPKDDHGRKRSHTLHKARLLFRQRRGIKFEDQHKNYRWDEKTIQRQPKGNRSRTTRPAYIL